MVDGRVPVIPSNVGDSVQNNLRLNRPVKEIIDPCHELVIVNTQHAFSAYNRHVALFSLSNYKMIIFTKYILMCRLNILNGFHHGNRMNLLEEYHISCFLEVSLGCKHTTQYSGYDVMGLFMPQNGPYPCC